MAFFSRSQPAPAPAASELDTFPAEALVSRGRGLQLKVGQLTATLAMDSHALSEAIRAAALPRESSSTTCRMLPARKSASTSP